MRFCLCVREGGFFESTSSELALTGIHLFRLVVCFPSGLPDYIVWEISCTIVNYIDVRPTTLKPPKLCRGHRRLACVRAHTSCLRSNHLLHKNVSNSVNASSIQHKLQSSAIPAQGERRIGRSGTRFKLLCYALLAAAIQRGVDSPSR